MIVVDGDFRRDGAAADGKGLKPDLLDRAAASLGEVGEQRAALHARVLQQLRQAGTVGDDGETSLSDFIEDNSAHNPFATASYNLLKEKLLQAFNGLNERERRVLKMRFGIEDGYARTLEEIGKLLHLTRERIRQIEAKALKKLRHPVRMRQLAGFLEAE